MKFNKNIFFVLMLALVVTIGLSASISAKTELKLYTWEGSDGLKIQQEMGKLFEEQYDDIELDVQTPPGSSSDYLQKVLTQVAAGSPPDVFQIGDGDVSTFADQGRLTNLTPFIEGENGLNKDEFFAGPLAYGNYQDEYYAFPKDYSPLVMYYNKDHFDEAGLDYPDDTWTWDDFLNAANKLKKTSGNRVTRYGATFGNLAESRFMIPFIWSNNGDVMNEDATKASGYLDSENTIEAMERIVDLVKKYKVTPAKSSMEALGGGDQMFLSGRTSMYFHGIWPMRPRFDMKKDLNYGTAVLPMMERPASVLFWAGYAMFDSVENKEAAWEALKFFVSADAQEIMGETRMIANKEAAERLGALDDPKLKTFYKLASYAEVPFELKGGLGAKIGRDNFVKALEKIFYTDADVAETFKETAKLIDEKIAEEMAEEE